MTANKLPASPDWDVVNRIEDGFNDSLDDLIGGATSTVRGKTPRAPEGFTPNKTFIEGCTKCRGTGQTRWGACFACKGKGKFQFKTSPEARAKSREQAVARKERVASDSFDTFAAASPAIAAWIVAKEGSFEFAAKMRDAIIRFGDLTEGQRAAVERCIARDAAKTAERIERIQQAPQADTAGIDRLKAAFDQAIAYSAEKGLKLSPRITVDGTTISPAKAASKNPGALYVKAGKTYLGKIAEGRFYASRDCTAEQEAKVLAFVADPAEAAKVYGQTTGTCCICNATLRSEWKNRGIGPVCAEKFGWA